MINEDEMNIFKIRKKEILPSSIAMLLIIFENIMMITYHFERYLRGGNLGFWSVFANSFTVSGFDPYTYMTLSRWNVYYAVYRHPLLSYMWYPFARLNEWQMTLTEHNYAIFIVAFVSIFCAFYTFLFLYRICRDIIGISSFDSSLLVFFFYSFAYIILTIMVPDHFCLSMFMLVLTLYIAGMKMRDSQLMSGKLTVFLYTIISGITLSNGVNVFLAQLFCNGKKTLKMRNLLLTFVLPTIILGALCVYQDVQYVKPREQQGLHIMEEKAKKDKNIAEKLKQTKATAKKMSLKDKLNVTKWMDFSTSRSETIVENLLGEGMYLHDNNLLEDNVETRPIFVTYNSVLPYIFIAIASVLFIMGGVLGCYDKFIKLCLSWCAFAMTLHIFFAFAINEVYIMSAHWMFVIPLCISYSFKRLKEKRMVKVALGLRTVLIALTVIFYVHNISLMIGYFMHI